MMHAYDSCVFSLIGAIGVIIGLYIVLWGKAEDVVDVKEKINPKSVANETEEVTFSNNESCGEANCKIDLEEPLLTNFLKTRSEIESTNSWSHGSIGSTS
jgi:S-ribosylhomocysteine lyase LuxS involved in autoinducer biosynthesis